LLNAAELRDSALGFLAMREHSRLELQRKLSKKTSDDILIDELLQALINEGLLSDERFTEAYIHMRQGKGFGPSRIDAELRERGVDVAIIAQYLDPQAEQWRQIANDVRQKRFGSPIPSDYKEFARQARFLQYRGFNVEHIKFND